MNSVNTNNFDFLRIVFATTVAIAHLIELSEIEIFQSYQRFFNTRLAIDGFFVISGFLIAKSYENTETIKKYIIKRIRRIIPAYLFVILFCAFFFCLISTKSVNDYFLSGQFWKYLLANLTFQNYFEPCLPGVFENNLICTVNGALWTIKIEEAFYLLLPLFYLTTKLKKKKVFIVGTLIYLLSIIYFNYFLSIGMYRIAKQLPGALAFFVCGILLYRNFIFFIRFKHYFILPCLILFFLEQYIFNTHVLKPITYGIMIFYIAYSFKWLNNFGKYGDLTYGIYIYHFPIIQVFIYFGLFYNYDPFVISLMFLLSVVILSALSWHNLELAFLSESRKQRQKKLKYKN